MMGKIRVHSCVSHKTPGRLSPECNCAWWISRTECEARVAAGELVRIPHDRRNIVAVFEPASTQTTRFPKSMARTISAHDMFHVACGNKCEKKRINEYGKLNQQFLANLGADERKRGSVTPPTKIMPHQPDDFTLTTIWNDYRTAYKAPAVTAVADKAHVTACKYCGGLVTDLDKLAAFVKPLPDGLESVRCPLCDKADGFVRLSKLDMKAA